MAVNDAVTMRMLAQHFTTKEKIVFLRIRLRQWIYMPGQQVLVVCLAHYDLGGIYEGKGDYTKAKFHLEAAAVMAGHEGSRTALGRLEFLLAKYEQPE